MNTTFSTGLVRVEVSSLSWLEQESAVNYPSQETEETSTTTRPVENVVLTTKGLQERTTQMLDGTTVEK